MLPLPAFAVRPAGAAGGDATVMLTVSVASSKAVWLVSVSDAVSVYVVVPAKTVAATLNSCLAASKLMPSGRLPLSAAAPADPLTGSLCFTV